MNLIRNLWTYKLITMIKDYFNYLKDKKIVKDSLYSNAFKIILQKYLNTNIKKDWLGRLYGVINPNIDENGNFDITRSIIEFDNDTTHNSEYVKVYVYKQMNLISELFLLKGLYDYLACDIEHVGPDTEDNYLVVISIVSKNVFINSLNKFIKHSILYMIIGLSILIISINIY